MMRLTPLVLALTLATSAWAQKVNYNFDQQADFTKYHTYKWVEIPGGVKIDDLTRGQLTAALDAELAKKGLAKTDADSADLYVGYQLAVDKEQQLNAYNSGWGYGPGWRGGYGMTTTTATTSTILNGTMALDMYDAPKKALVWRGTATKTLDPGAKPDKRAKNMQKAAEKLLKNYPPPLKK